MSYYDHLRLKSIYLRMAYGSKSAGTQNGSYRFSLIIHMSIVQTVTTTTQKNEMSI